jgi:hypothetical protein
MVKAAQAKITIDFGDSTRPEGYIVSIEPEGGAAIGTWGGSSNLDPANQVIFSDVPPGRYVIQGRPNPSNGQDQTKPLTIELVGGKTTEVTLMAQE